MELAAAVFVNACFADLKDVMVVVAVVVVWIVVDERIGYLNDGWDDLINYDLADYEVELTMATVGEDWIGFEMNDDDDEGAVVAAVVVVL